MKPWSFLSAFFLRVVLFLATLPPFVFGQYAPGTNEQRAATWTGAGWPSVTINVQTIAALKALNVATFATGMKVHVEGYYASGDQGGGDFVYNSASAATADNGWIVAPNAGSGRWLRPTTEPLSVRKYGAKGDASTDDTVAIQACINYAATHGNGPGLGTLQKSMRIWFETGVYVISALNLTNCTNLEIDCSGEFGAALYAQNQVSAAPILDMSKTRGCRIKNITLQASTTAGAAPAVPPTVGILLAETVATGDCDENRFDSVSAGGFFSKCALALYGAPDCPFYNCIFSTSTVNGIAVFAGTTNDLSLSSPNQTLIATASDNSNDSFFGCEFHGQRGVGTGSTIELYGVGNLLISGGNCDSSSSAQVLVKGTNNGLTFQTVGFYSEFGTAPSMIVRNTGTINGLAFLNCGTGNNAGNSSVLGGSPSAVYSGVTMIGKVVQEGNAIGSGNTITITNSFIECDGAQVNINAGSITNTILLNPGNITAAVDQSTYNFNRGLSTLTSLTSGQNNFAFGTSALQSLTSASNCIAIGRRALNAITNGSWNIGLGEQALEKLGSGVGNNNNVAVGPQCLDTITTGSGNFGFGDAVLDALTSGNANFGFGIDAGQQITTGDANMYFGQNSGDSNFGSESNQFYLDNTGVTAGRTGSLLWGTFNATPSAQQLTVNGTLNAPNSIGRVTADIPSTSTTLANAAGLTVTVEASRNYQFHAVLYTTSNVAGGVKFAIAGTATATSVIYEAVVSNGAAVSAQTRATSLGTAVGGVTAVTTALCKIDGTITVNAGGTLTVQFAENTAVSTSNLLRGSTFEVIGCN